MDGVLAGGIAPPPPTLGLSSYMLAHFRGTLGELAELRRTTRSSRRASAPVWSVDSFASRDAASIHAWPKASLQPKNKATKKGNKELCCVQLPSVRTWPAWTLHTAKHILCRGTWSGFIVPPSVLN